MTAPLDPATVQRCIEALKGSGQYQRNWVRKPYQRDDELVETWTYTTHPMDILQALLTPEKSEAENLVDEWEKQTESCIDVEYIREDLTELAQFILDKRNPAEVLRDIAKDFAEEHGYAVDHQSFYAGVKHCESTEPQFVFGPWMPAVDGLTPPFPAGWYYQMRSTRTGEVNPIVQPVRGRFESINTEYRVRFEVGKWYDWTGGPCPVDGDVRVAVEFRDGSHEGCSPAGFWSSGVTDWWKHESCSENNIVRFKVLP